MPSLIRSPVTTAAPQCYAHIKAKVNAHNTASPKPLQPHASAYAAKAAIADEVRRQQNREMRRKLAKVGPKVASNIKRQSPIRHEQTSSSPPSEPRIAQGRAPERLPTSAHPDASELTQSSELRRADRAVAVAIADEVRRQQNREMRRKLAKVGPKVDSCNKTLLKRQTRSHREDTPSQMPSERRNAQGSARQRLAAVTATTSTEPKVSEPTRLSRPAPGSVSRPAGRESKPLREYAMPRNPMQSPTDSHDGSLCSTGSDSDSDTSSTSNSMVSPRDTHTIQTPNAKHQTTAQPSADSQNRQMALQTPPDQDHSIEMTKPLRRRIQPMKPKETPSFWDCWDGF